MKILGYFLLPVLIVGAYAAYIWLRNRQPSSVESGIDAFRREMSALSPDAAPVNRRPDRSPDGSGIPRQAPRRPGPRDPGGEAYPLDQFPEEYRADEYPPEEPGHPDEGWR